MRFLRSLWRAAAALSRALREEHNFRLQVIGGVMVVAAAVVAGVKRLELALLVAAVGAVPALELINSALERLVDVMQPRVHHLAAAVKNLMAGAVLFAAGVALLIGGLILWPYLAPILWNMV